MRNFIVSIVLRLLLFIIVCSISIVQLGCSKSPEVAKTSPVDVIPSSSPTLSYQVFLNEGINKCLNGEYKEAVVFLLKAKEISPREGKIHFWLFQAYKNSETDTSKKSKAYIEAQNIIALMPNSSQSQQAQEFVNKVESFTQPPKCSASQPVIENRQPDIVVPKTQVVNIPSQTQSRTTPEIQLPSVTESGNLHNSPALGESEIRKSKEEFKRKLEEKRSADRLEAQRRDRQDLLERQKQEAEAQRMHAKEIQQQEHENRCNEEAARNIGDIAKKIMGY